ncbi:energy transducer TonB [Viscerimonas tarda]
MAKEVNLNSSEWCDMIFEGKNKKYGAYFLRQSSSKRHLVAFLIVLIGVGVISAIPSIMEAVKRNSQNLGGVEDAFELSNITNVEEQVPEENIIKQETAPPPPPLKATIQFTPPIITEDEKVSEDDAMKSQDELNENKNIQVSIATVEGSNDKDAVDIADLKDHKVIVQEVAEEKPFVSVEQMPNFPGGMGELNKFIASNLKYPTIASENGISGRVIVRFVVGKEGKVSDIQIMRGLDASCDKEARRVVELMPKWIPGMQNGRAVPVYFTLPIIFKLAQ